MARKRNDEHNAEIAEAIKLAARKLMAEQGTHGLSVRGIAKELDLTPPAIYHYFASLDDLTTALIVDSFNALADALELASQTSTATTAGTKMFDVIMAYRQWAVDFPIDFQLIYGNPIPGYAAPRDATVPAVVRTFVVNVALMEEALQTGELVPIPPYNKIPAEVAARLQELISQNMYPIAPISMYLTFVIWTQIHGIIYLEIYNHIQANVANVELFYRTQVQNILEVIGMRPPD